MSPVVESLESTIHRLSVARQYRPSVARQVQIFHFQQTMPMEKSYNEQLKSKIADLKNIGGRYGGAITAGLFLQNFVDKKKPFAHIDIAGPVWDHANGVATGYGAKLVAEWIARQGK